MIELFKFFLMTLSLFAFCYSNPIEQPSHLDREDLFEGDIMGANIELNSKGLAQIEDSRYVKWPGGIVPYKIDKNYTQAQLNVIYSGMRLLENSTRINANKYCVRFVERTNEPNWVRIFSESGCWSMIGKQTWAGEQGLSLKNPNCVYKGIVAHELMHTLGFWHEQSRPDRDNYVTINWNNVMANQQHNFNKYQTGNTLGLTYDYNSIMHYESTAFSSNGQPTIVAKQSGVQLIPSYNKNAITQTDIAAIRKFYNCS